MLYNLLLLRHECAPVWLVDSGLAVSAVCLLTLLLYVAWVAQRLDPLAYINRAMRRAVQESLGQQDVAPLHETLGLVVQAATQAARNGVSIYWQDALEGLMRLWIGGDQRRNLPLRHAARDALGRFLQSVRGDSSVLIEVLDVMRMFCARHCPNTQQPTEYLARDVASLFADLVMPFSCTDDARQAALTTLWVAGTSFVRTEGDNAVVLPIATLARCAERDAARALVGAPHIDTSTPETTLATTKEYDQLVETVLRDLHGRITSQVRAFIASCNVDAPDELSNLFSAMVIE
jgi:hypothetical protein